MNYLPGFLDEVFITLLIYKWNNLSKEIKKGSKGIIVTQDNDACRLLQFCPDIEGWPTSWAGEEIDITPGRDIVEFLKPFLLYLLTTKLSPKTLRRYRDHMWMLGGG